MGARERSHWCRRTAPVLAESAGPPPLGNLPDRGRSRGVLTDRLCLLAAREVFHSEDVAQEIGFYTSTQHEFDSEKQVHVTKPMSVSEPPPKPMLPAPPRVNKIFNKRTPLEGAAGFAALNGAFKRGAASHDFLAVFFLSHQLSD